MTKSRKQPHEMDKRGDVTSSRSLARARAAEPRSRARSNATVVEHERPRVRAVRVDARRERVEKRAANTASADDVPSRRALGARGERERARGTGE